MSVEENARLIVEAEAKGFAETTAKIVATETSLQALTADYKSGAVGLDEYMKKGTHLQSELDQLRESYRIADEAVKRYGSTTAATAALTAQYSTASRGAQERTRGLAYAMNDFFAVQGGLQQRLGAIANNLPQMFAGMSPKMVNFGLALGAIAPMIGVIIANWDTLGAKVDEVLGGIVGSGNWARIKEVVVSTFGSAIAEAKDHVEALKEKVKTLDEKPHKLAMDYVDLEVARKELDQITAALGLVDRMRKKQQEPEKKAGEGVSEALEGAEGGFGKVQDELRANKVQEMLNDPNGQLASTQAAIGKINEQIKAAEALANHAGILVGEAGRKAEEARKSLPRLKADRERLETNRRDQQTSITRTGGEADVAVDEQIHGAVEGKGEDQKVKRDALAKGLDAIGRNDLANQVREAESLEQYDKEAEDFQRHMERATMAGQLRRDKAQKHAAAQKKLELAFKKHIDEELDQMQAVGDIDKEVDRLKAEAEKKGLKGKELAESVGAGTEQFIRNELGNRGIKPPDELDQEGRSGAAEPIFNAAVAAAKKARIDVERKDKGEDKAEQTAEQRVAAHQAAAADKFHFDQEATDAKNIVDRFGHQAVQVFEQQIKSSMLPAEQAAKNLVNVLTQQFTDASVRFAVANRAARAVVEKAGVKVETGMDAATEQRVAGVRAAMAAERQRGGQIGRPKAGKKPMPKVAANKPPARAPLGPNAVVNNDAERARQWDKGRREAAAKRQREIIDKAAKDKAAKKPAPNPADQAALEKAVDVTAKTQDAIAAGQTIDHQLLTRLAVLERRQATIEGTNKSLMNRAMEAAPTASNSGGSIA